MKLYVFKYIINNKTNYIKKNNFFKKNRFLWIVNPYISYGLTIRMVLTDCQSIKNIRIVNL